MVITEGIEKEVFTELEHCLWCPLWVQWTSTGWQQMTTAEYTAEGNNDHMPLHVDM